MLLAATAMRAVVRVAAFSLEQRRQSVTPTCDLTSLEHDGFTLVVRHGALLRRVHALVRCRAADTGAAMSVRRQIQARGGCEHCLCRGLTLTLTLTRTLTLTSCSCTMRCCVVDLHAMALADHAEIVLEYLRWAREAWERTWRSMTACSELVDLHGSSMAV